MCPLLCLFRVDTTRFYFFRLIFILRWILIHLFPFLYHSISSIYQRDLPPPFLRLTFRKKYTTLTSRGNSLSPIFSDTYVYLSILTGCFFTEEYKVSFINHWLYIFYIRSQLVETMSKNSVSHDIMSWIKCNRKTKETLVLVSTLYSIEQKYSQERLKWIKEEDVLNGMIFN